MTKRNKGTALTYRQLYYWRAKVQLSKEPKKYVE